MRLLALIAVAVTAYALGTWALPHVFGVAPSSSWYWLPFGLSFAVLAAGFAFDYRKQRQPLARVAATLIASAILTGIADIVVAVAHSCFEGVCM